MDVDRLDIAEGGSVMLDKVLLLADGKAVTVGKPFIEGARVMAIAKSNGRGDKIIVYKFKSKVRYRRKKGHHQLFTTLSIDKILPPGVEAPKPVKRARRKKKVETKEETTKEETADGA
jgi:large subunit ribosomal protein L21